MRNLIYKRIAGHHTGFLQRTPSDQVRSPHDDLRRRWAKRSVVGKQRDSDSTSRRSS
jgi:hypothetical protein